MLYNQINNPWGSNNCPDFQFFKLANIDNPIPILDNANLNSIDRVAVIFDKNLIIANLDFSSYADKSINLFDDIYTLTDYLNVSTSLSVSDWMVTSLDAEKIMDSIDQEKLKFLFGDKIISGYRISTQKELINAFILVFASFSCSSSVEEVFTGVLNICGNLNNITISVSPSIIAYDITPTLCILASPYKDGKSIAKKTLDKNEYSICSYYYNGKINSIISADYVSTLKELNIPFYKANYITFFKYNELGIYISTDIETYKKLIDKIIDKNVYYDTFIDAHVEQDIKSKVVNKKFKYRSLKEIYTTNQLLLPVSTKMATYYTISDNVRFNKLLSKIDKFRGFTKIPTKLKFDNIQQRAKAIMTKFGLINLMSHLNSSVISSGLSIKSADDIVTHSIQCELNLEDNTLVYINDSKRTVNKKNPGFYLAHLLIKNIKENTKNILTVEEIIDLYSLCISPKNYGVQFATSAIIVGCPKVSYIGISTHNRKLQKVIKDGTIKEVNPDSVVNLTYTTESLNNDKIHNSFSQKIITKYEIH